MDDQTRLEQEHYALKVAYQLVRDDVQRLIEARDRFGGDNQLQYAALNFLDGQLDRRLRRAPND